MKNEQVDERPYAEIMEELGQLNIFDVLEADNQQMNEVEIVGIGDKVSVQISEDDVDADNYFKYYYPHVLTSIGEVVGVENDLYQVRFKSDVLLFHRHEIVL